MISFGLTDPLKLTMPIILEILKINKNFIFHVPLLKKTIDENKLIFHTTKMNLHENIIFYDNLEYLGQLMLKSDFCIGSLGTSTWERCCLGLPTLGIMTNDNQKQFTI